MRDSNDFYILKGDFVTLARLLGFALVALLSTGCSSIHYSPSEYQITSDRIQDFKVSGNVSIQNLQPDSADKVVLKAPARDWVSDYHSATAVFSDQLKKEIGIHGGIPRRGADKTIGVKVTDQKAFMHVFHMTGTFAAMVTLGTEAPFTISIEQGNPGGVWRCLDENIAHGVVALLSDKRVLDYLAD